MNARVILISILFICGLASTALAQETISSEDVTITFNQQLIDLDSRETQLRTRLEDLDEQLKPENIAWAVAGIGSTRPEELREHLRKLLTIERVGIQTQLDLIAEDRARINAAIATAEYAAYLKYALPPLPGMLRVSIIAKDPDAPSYNVTGAYLKLKDKAQLIEALSDDRGDYEFGNLSPGEYTLEVSAQGFKTTIKTVTVHAEETSIENITLEIGP